MRPSRASSVSSTTSTSFLQDQTQQIFIKLLSSETISLTIPIDTSLPTLLNLLSLRTAAPPTSLRLVYAGRHLTAKSPTHSEPQQPPTLSSLRIPPNATLHLALPIRGGMAPKKQKCQFKECKDAAQRIVGDCSFCLGDYCGKHRMLEDHACKGLENCQQEARERNKNTLEGERTSAIKGI